MHCSIWVLPLKIFISPMYSSSYAFTHRALHALHWTVSYDIVENKASAPWHHFCNPVWSWDKQIHHHSNVWQRQDEVWRVMPSRVNTAALAQSLGLIKGFREKNDISIATQGMRQAYSSQKVTSITSGVRKWARSSRAVGRSSVHEGVLYMVIERIRGPVYSIP